MGRFLSIRHSNMGVNISINEGYKINLSKPLKEIQKHYPYGALRWNPTLTVHLTSIEKLTFKGGTSGRSLTLSVPPRYKSALKESKLVNRFKIAYHTYFKRFVAKKVRKNKSYDFFRDIAINCYYQAMDGKQKKMKSNRKRLFVTPAERPPREEIIEKSTKFSRLANK